MPRPEIDLASAAALAGRGGCSIYVPSRRAPLTSKCSASQHKNLDDLIALQGIHQTSTVIRSGEWRPGENASGPLAPKLVNSLYRITLLNNGKTNRSRIGRTLSRGQVAEEEAAIMGSMLSYAVRRTPCWHGLLCR